MTSEDKAAEAAARLILIIIDGFVLVVFCVTVLFWAGVKTGAI